MVKRCPRRGESDSVGNGVNRCYGKLVPFTQVCVRHAENLVCREVGDFQWVRIPSGQSVARPEAIRAMEDRAACVNTRQQVTVFDDQLIARRPKHLTQDPAAVLKANGSTIALSKRADARPASRGPAFPAGEW